MIWDGLIITLIVLLAIAGWTVGIVNSWRGPFAIVVATIATQQFYVDFATWVVQQLRVAPEVAVIIAYLLLWGAVEIICELAMNLILPFGRKSRPLFFERLAGAAFGVFKGIVAVLLPVMALNGPIKVPHPPPDKSDLINPIVLGIGSSIVVGGFQSMAKSLYPAMNSVVVSQKSPSFTPDFSGKTALDQAKPKSSK